MRFPLTSILLCALPLLSFCQNTFLSGYWYGAESAFSYGNANGVYVFENGQIFRADYMKESSRYDKWVANSNNVNAFEFAETSLNNKNNALHTWINTCDTYVWTETQTGEFFHYGNPYILEYKWTRNVNNKTGEDCFDANNKCFSKMVSGYARMVPILRTTNLIIGGKGSPYVTIAEFRLTEQTTELTLKFSASETGGTLHPPGSEKAYAIIDATGKEYKLLAQFGWKGSDDDGFGTKSKINESYVILFFEPMQNTGNLTFNPKEGACFEGCWNFYDVKPK